jgi:hypothetical protein
MALYAFNGTWNSEKTDDLATTAHEDEGNTNVIRFRGAYEGQHTSYCNGVGTRLSWFGKLVGIRFLGLFRNDPGARCVGEDSAAELVAAHAAVFKE